MKVTLVFTVLNEGETIRRLLDSIAAQTRLPDEIIACDGGSRDDTVTLLRGENRLPVRVIEAPGANISRGRNLAIAAASHDIIACTDAGVRLDPRWLEKLTEPFQISDFRLQIEENHSVGDGDRPHRDVPQSAIGNRKSVVAGFFLPDPHTTFEVAMGATVLPAVDEIHPQTFLPSSRSVAFRKRAWQAAGGYPEWLDYCEDLIFDLGLRDCCGAFAFAPEAIAYFRPRGSLRAFFRQYYLYARGDGKAGLFFKRHMIRYGLYLVALPVLLIGIVTGAPPVKLACVTALLAGGVAYVRQPVRRLRTLARNLNAIEKIQVIALVPVIRVVGDVAKMLGYPVGVVWRARHRKNQTARSTRADGK